jgi:hypothetical protein
MKLPSKRKVRRLRRRKRIRDIRIVKSMIKDNSKLGYNYLNMWFNFHGLTNEDFVFACRFISYKYDRFHIEGNDISQKLCWKLI